MSNHDHETPAGNSQCITAAIRYKKNVCNYFRAITFRTSLCDFVINSPVNSLLGDGDNDDDWTERIQSKCAYGGDYSVALCTNTIVEIKTSFHCRPTRSSEKWMNRQTTILFQIINYRRAIWFCFSITLALSLSPIRFAHTKKVKIKMEKWK